MTVANDLTCDRNLVLTFDDIKIKPGCQNYTLDDKNWLSCDRVSVFDVVTRGCVSLLSASWEPCPIFYNTVDNFKSINDSSEKKVTWTANEYLAKRIGHSNYVYCAGCIMNFNQCSLSCGVYDLVKNMDSSNKRSSVVLDNRSIKPKDIKCDETLSPPYIVCGFNAEECKLRDYTYGETLGVVMSDARTKFVACYEEGSPSILTNDTCTKFCRDTVGCQYYGLLCNDSGCSPGKALAGECYCSYSTVRKIERFGYLNYEFAENTCSIVLEETKTATSMVKSRRKRDSAFVPQKTNDEIPDILCRRLNNTVDCGELVCDYRMSIGNMSTLRVKADRAILNLNVSVLSTSPVLSIILYCDDSKNYEFIGLADKLGDLVMYTKILSPVDMCDGMNWWQRSTHIQCIMNDHMNVDWALRRMSMVILAVLVLVTVLVIIKIIRMLFTYMCWKKQNEALDQIANAMTGNLKGSQDDLLELGHLRELYKSQMKRYSLWRRLTCWKYRAEKRMMVLMFRIGSESKLDVVNMTDKIINLKNDLGIDSSVEEKALSILRQDTFHEDLSDEGSAVDYSQHNGSVRGNRMQRLRLLGLALLLLCNNSAHCEERVCSGHIVTGKFTSCQNNPDGKSIVCEVTSTASVDILSVGQSVCLSIMNGSDVALKLDVTYEDLSRVWSTSMQYTTGSYNGVTSQRKKCRDGGYCDSKCNGQTEKNHLYGEDSKLIGFEHEMYTESVCCNWLVTAFECGDMRKCGGVSMSLDTYGLPRSDVLSLITGENAASILVNYKSVDDIGDTVKKSVRVKMGQTEQVESVDVTLITVSNLPTVELNDNKLILNETTAFIAKASEVNNPVAGILGELQSNNKDAWDNPMKSRSSSQSTFKTASDLIELSCDQWSNYHELMKPIYDGLSTGKYQGSVMLPGVYGSNLWRYERETSQLIEEINGTRPISVKIDISGNFEFSVMTHKCSPEIQFKNITGCFECEYGGAELTLLVSTVNGYGCHVVVNHISNQLTCIGTIPIETGEPQLRNLNCFGKVNNVDEEMIIRYNSKDHVIRVIGELVLANYTTDDETVMTELNSAWNEITGFFKGLGIVAASLLGVAAVLAGAFVLGGLCLGWSNLFAILGGFFLTRMIMNVLCCGMMNNKIEKARADDPENEKLLKLREKFNDIKQKASDTLSSEKLQRRVRNSAGLFNKN